MSESILTAALPPGRIRNAEREMVAAAQRDPVNFTNLYRQYISVVYRYLYQRLGNPNTAQRLTEDVFNCALEQLGEYPPERPFVVWLLGITRRKVGRRPLSRPATADRLARLIYALDEDDQEIIRLRYIADLNPEEIAVLLEQPSNTIQKSLERLLDGLQAQYEVYHE
jgi:DNA-directed RNA polymerase specialized sigma24 family protein